MQDFNTLIPQCFALVRRGLAVDRSRFGFFVVDFSCLFGKLLADILALAQQGLYHLPIRRH